MWLNNTQALALWAARIIQAAAAHTKIIHKIGSVRSCQVPASTICNSHNLTTEGLLTHCIDKTKSVSSLPNFTGLIWLQSSWSFPLFVCNTYNDGPVSDGHTHSILAWRIHGLYSLYRLYRLYRLSQRDLTEWLSLSWRAFKTEGWAPFPEFLIQSPWCETWEFAFLTSDTAVASGATLGDLHCCCARCIWRGWGWRPFRRLISVI